MLFNGYRVSVLQDEKYSGDEWCLPLHNNVNALNATLEIAKMVNFMLCVFYHNCAQLSLTLCDSMDCSPPGSSVNGILR